MVFIFNSSKPVIFYCDIQGTNKAVIFIGDFTIVRFLLFAVLTFQRVKQHLLSLQVGLQMPRNEHNT